MASHTVECTVTEAGDYQSTRREREGLRGLEMQERQQVREPESVLTSLFLKDMAGMKRSILGILELIAVTGSRTVEWFTAKGGVSFGGGGEEEGGELLELVEMWTGELR